MYLFQVEVKSYSFPTEYCFDQVRAPCHRYYQRTMSIVHLTHQWQYHDFLYDHVTINKLSPIYLVRIEIVQINVLKNFCIDEQFDTQDLKMNLFIPQYICVIQ